VFFLVEAGENLLNDHWIFDAGDYADRTAASLTGLDVLIIGKSNQTD